MIIYYIKIKLPGHDEFEKVYSCYAKALLGWGIVAEGARRLWGSVGPVMRRDTETGEDCIAYEDIIDRTRPMAVEAVAGEG